MSSKNNIWSGRPRNLRWELNKIGIKFGSAVDPSTFEKDGKWIRNNLVSLTPETAMKMGAVMENSYTYNFTRADKICDFAQKHNLKVHGHCLMWNLFNPEWLNTYSPENRRKFLHNFIFTSLNHYQEFYPGVVEGFDVVNEGYERYGNEYHDYWWNCGATVAWALELARYTNYKGAIWYNDNQTSKEWQTSILSLCKTKLIDGVGLQMHITDDGIPKDTMNFIYELCNLGMRVRFSEVDVNAQNPEPIWHEIGKLLRSRMIEGFTTWGYSTKYWWKKDQAKNDIPVLFDKKLNPNTAYRILMEELKDI